MHVPWNEYFLNHQKTPTLKLFWCLEAWGKLLASRHCKGHLLLIEPIDEFSEWEQETPAHGGTTPRSNPTFPRKCTFHSKVVLSGLVPTVTQLSGAMVTTRPSQTIF